MPFFSHNEPPDWWARLRRLGTTCTLINQAPVLNYSMHLCPKEMEWKRGRKSERYDHQGRNRMKQRWSSGGGEKKSERKGERLRGQGVLEGREQKGKDEEKWREVFWFSEEGWQDFKVGCAFWGMIALICFGFFPLFLAWGCRHGLVALLVSWSAASFRLLDGLPKTDIRSPSGWILLI